MKKVILSIVFISLVLLNSCKLGSEKSNSFDSTQIKTIDSEKVTIDSVKIVDSIK